MRYPRGTTVTTLLKEALQQGSGEPSASPACLIAPTPELGSAPCWRRGAQSIDGAWVKLGLSRHEAETDETRVK